MADAPNLHLAMGRKFTQMAAQWLLLIHFKFHAYAPAFSPSVSTYHDMLDPQAADGARVNACRLMLKEVKEQILLEDRKGREAYARLRPIDPYRKHWKTTAHGASLSAIASLLTGAIEAFERAAAK